MLSMERVGKRWTTRIPWEEAWEPLVMVTDGKKQGVEREENIELLP